MSEQTITPNSEYVKPCVKCGAQDRYGNGDCKPCARARSRKWVETNPEKHRENNHKYRKSNLERERENKRRWRQGNREKDRETTRKRVAENPEKYLSAKRKWAAQNPDKRCESKRKWRAANPEKVNVLTQNRRAKKKGNGGKLSKDIAQRLLILQKGKCACGCGADLKQTGHHLDHIMPISLGGKNTDDNIQLLTPKCNLRKSAKHPDDWARENGRLI